MDIAMPQMTGLAAAREICRGADHPFVLMLSMYDNEQYFFQALKPAPLVMSSSRWWTRTW